MQIALLLLALLALPALADVTGVVVGVADGDTVTVLAEDKTQHKIRLAGIDAPEKGQPFGQKAKAKRVGLWADADPAPPWEWRRK